MFPAEIGHNEGGLDAMTKEEREVLQEREKELRKTHKRITPGSIKKETTGHWAGKYTVEINCDQRGCTAKRRVATSDLHQVSSCESCTKKLRAERRRERRAELSAKRGKSKPKASKAKVSKPKPKTKAKPKAKPAAKPEPATTNHDKPVLPALAVATAD